MDLKEINKFYNNSFVKKSIKPNDKKNKEKRRNFRKLIKDKFYIKNERLYYKYKVSNRILEKKFHIYMKKILYFIMPISMMYICHLKLKN